MKDIINTENHRFWKSDFLNRDVEFENRRREIAKSLNGKPYDVYLKSLKLAKVIE
jgi:hypothetical protein|tara:strand:+ start:390 stop:554 length:165 start_codon:yes stop_codon:yes gene_type:complete